MLRKYMSDRGKIRARRVSGNCTSTSATWPSPSRRPVSSCCFPTRSAPPRSAPVAAVARWRDGGFGGGRRGRDEERTLGEEGASTAIPDGTPPAVAPTEVEVVEVEVVELDTGEGDRGRRRVG